MPQPRTEARPPLVLLQREHQLSRQVLLPRQGAQAGMRALQHRGRLRAEEVRYAPDLIAHHRGLRQQVVAVDPPGPGIGPRRISQHHQPVRQVPVRIDGSSAGLLE